MPKNAKKAKCDGPTDRPTDRPTDGPTDAVAYRSRVRDKKVKFLHYFETSLDQFGSSDDR